MQPLTFFFLEDTGIFKQGREDLERKQAFEAKKPITCSNCQDAGHIAAGCGKRKLVFACGSQREENDELRPIPLYFDCGRQIMAGFA